MRKLKLTIIALVLILAISLAVNYLVKADHFVYQPSCEERGGRFVPVGVKSMIFICKVEK